MMALGYTLVGLMLVGGLAFAAAIAAALWLAVPDHRDRDRPGGEAPREDGTDAGR